METFPSGSDNYCKDGKTENSIRKNLHTQTDDSSQDKDICSLCDRPLVGHPRTEEIEGDRWSQIAAVEPFSSLTCGHNFHDECLLGKFNEALQCPTCGRKEDS
ncbi:hypothetical protein PInf_026895 [Phytophthora infestans]|nr:hypothetical protein PInf_026895 [Phytophthora infestans]